MDEIKLDKKRISCTNSLHKFFKAYLVTSFVYAFENYRDVSVPQESSRLYVEKSNQILNQNVAFFVKVQLG